MKLWLRKIMVALVAVVTLGMYVPPIALTTDAEESKDALSERPNVDEQNATVSITEDRYASVSYVEPTESNVDIAESTFTKEDYIDEITEQAKEQAFMKFGPRMIDQVEGDFTANILQVIEDVLESVMEDASDDEIRYYAITEEPARGLGERIFNIYDERNEKDIVRFHVRRENRPLEGYWFNFHYHLNEDNFEKHHDIGDMYWDKNIPPRWMS